MANVFKNGIVRGTGNVGANILPGTSAEEIQYWYPSSGFSDKFSKKTSIVPSGSQYTLSFYAKSTNSGDKIRAHYYNPNTTTRGETNQGVVSTASDGNIDFTLSNKWEFYCVTYTQSSTTATKTIIFPRMFSQERSEAAKGLGIVSIRNLKFEAGSSPTPWIPCSTDATYINGASNMVEGEGMCQIFKSGCIQATEFIEK
jgi:hypothetical protein